jgi:hypothetical protein
VELNKISAKTPLSGWGIGDYKEVRHFQQVTCLKIISFVFAILQIRMTLIIQRLYRAPPILPLVTVNSSFV